MCIADLELNGIRLIPISSEHSHSMVEDVATTLNTLVKPCGSMALPVEWDRKGLAATIVYSVNESNIEFVWMFSKMMRTGHACDTCQRLVSCFFA